MNQLSRISFNQEISLMEFFNDSYGFAKVIGYCKEPVCILMKYYKLGSLDNNIETCKSNHVLNDVAKALQVMHQRKVAHCDLKPQNILVEEGKDHHHYLLTDFGISKILTPEYLASDAFQIRNLRGLTVSYAAPDSLKRFRQKIPGFELEEKAGDIYSFAVLIYFVLTSRNPWDQE
jgi:serine/threonine protein kinase